MYIDFDDCVNIDLIQVYLPLILELFLALPQPERLARLRSVILMEIFHLHHIPNGRVLHSDLVKLNLALVNPALDLTVLLATAALFNGLELFGELLYALQDDVD